MTKCDKILKEFPCNSTEQITYANVLDAMQQTAVGFAEWIKTFDKLLRKKWAEKSQISSAELYEIWNNQNQQL